MNHWQKTLLILLRRYKWDLSWTKPSKKRQEEDENDKKLCCWLVSSFLFLKKVLKMEKLFLFRFEKGKRYIFLASNTHLHTFFISKKRKINQMWGLKSFWDRMKCISFVARLLRGKRVVKEVEIARKWIEIPNDNSHEISAPSPSK